MAARPASATRIAFVGAGHVGATAAYATMLRGLFAEIVLVDQDEALAKAEAADLSDANALARPARIWAGSYADAATARIAVVSAGAASHGDESRLSLAARSAAIVRDCVTALAANDFSGVLVIASNPVDVMTAIAMRHAGLPHGQVLGTGTLLDTSRLQRALSIRLDVAPRSIEGYVLGEHGDSEVAALSTVRVGGLSLDRFAARRSASPVDLAGIADDVRSTAYRIIAGKGYTSYGIATAIVRICEAIVRDEHEILPVSAWLTGEFGLTDLCLSLPCILGAQGVVEILTPELTTDETAALQASATIIRDALAGLPEDRAHSSG